MISRMNSTVFIFLIIIESKIAMIFSHQTCKYITKVNCFSYINVIISHHALYDILM